MTSKYDTKDCEFYSLMGLRESWFFARSGEFMHKQSAHSSNVSI